MNRTQKIVASLLFSTCVQLNAYGADTQSLSTSEFFAVDTESRGVVTSACSTQVNPFASYVSLEIGKYRVSKSDGFSYRLFNKNRRAFAAASFGGSIHGNDFRVSRVGTPHVLKKADSHVDLASSFLLMDKTVWSVRGARLDVRIGYSADSTFNEILEAYNSITATIPDYTVSSAVTIAASIASSLDRIVFGSDRVTDLLNSSDDISAFTKLCEGAYVALAAKDASLYENYGPKNLVWDDGSKRLMHNGEELTKVSYAVLLVRVYDRMYEPIETALNETTKEWPKKFSDAQVALSRLSFTPTAKEIEVLSKTIVQLLDEGLTLLSADVRLVQEEKKEIYNFVRNDLEPKLAAIRTRVTEDNTVTLESTRESIAAFIQASDESTYEFRDETLDQLARMQLSLGDYISNDADDNTVVAQQLMQGISEIETNISGRFAGNY